MEKFAFGLNLNPFESTYLWFLYFAPYVAVLLAVSLIVAYRQEIRDKVGIKLIAWALLLWAALRFWQTKDYAFKFWGWGENTLAPLFVALIMLGVAVVIYLAVYLVKSKLSTPDSNSKQD